MSPRVSVVIATYRRPAQLLRAIRTALAQTMADLEVIVAIERDDAESPAALASISDRRVRHVVNPVRNGPGPARDCAAAAATGAYIAFLDDDDEWLPDKLARQLEIADDGRAIITTLSRVTSPAGTAIMPTLPYDGSIPIDEWLFDRRTWFGGRDSMLQTSSLMVPRGLFAVLRFGASMHEEWEFAIRAMKEHGYGLRTVAEPLVVYQAGGTYPWRGSITWVERMRGLLTKRAIAGFCLTVAVQSAPLSEHSRAAVTCLRAAFRWGRPTARQMFVFLMIWALPQALRFRIRHLLARG